VQNQTDPDWLSGLSPSDLGTGLFLIPDVHSDRFGAVKKEFVPGITYSECIRRGLFVIAFKWIPIRVHDFSTLQAQAGHCGQPCTCSCVVPG
jgi:hypothetical protein